MERKSPILAGDNPSNWANNDGITRNGLDANGTPINGTPKSANSVAEGGEAIYVIINIALDRIETSAGTPNSSLIEVKLVDKYYLIDKTENLTVTLTQAGPTGTFTANPVNCISGYGTTILQNVTSSGTVTVSATLPSGYSAVFSDTIWVDDVDTDGPILISISPDTHIQKNLASYATIEAVVNETGGMNTAIPITLNYEVRDDTDTLKGGGTANMNYISGAVGGGDGEPVYGPELLYKAAGVDLTNGGTITLVNGDKLWVWITGTDYKGQPFDTTNNSSANPFAKIPFIETKLLITEVNFLDSSGGGGIKTDWVEIYCVDDGNNGNGINLSGYFIDDLDSVSANPGNPDLADLNSLESNADKKIGDLTVKTGEYILLIYKESKTDETIATNKLIKIYTSDSGLTSTDEQIALFSPEGRIIDMVAWADQSGSLSDTDLNKSFVAGTGEWNLNYETHGSGDEADCVPSNFSKGTIVRDSKNSDTNDKKDWFHTEYATPGGPHPPDTLPDKTVLVINEVMFNSVSGKSDWIEVYCKDDGNNGNGVNIGGCYFFMDSIVKSIKDGTRIRTGEYLVLFQGRESLDQKRAGPDGVISIYAPKLAISSTDEQVVLKDFSGNIEDVVIFAQNDRSSYQLPLDSDGNLLPGATMLPDTAVYELKDLYDVSYVEYNDNVEILAEIDKDKGIQHWVGQNIKFFPNLAKYPDWPGGDVQPNYSYVYDWVYVIEGAVNSKGVKEGYSITRDDKSTDTNTAADWSISRTPTIGRGTSETENPELTISDILIEPNPFINDGSDPSRLYTKIAFSLNTQAVVTIRIYDIQGRVVRTLINKEDVAMGEFNIKWFGNDNKNRPAPIGVYIVYIEAINDVSTAVKKKTVVVGKKL